MVRFVALAVPLLGLLLAPLAAEAQQAGKVYRIGLLLPGPVTPADLAVLTKPLADLGWVEGRNLVIELRYPERGQHERLSELAAELVRLKVDLIAALGLTAPYATRATSTIPIVLWGASDPLKLGLVPSLARPGGNVTGTSWTVSLEELGKRLELLKEVVPQISRVAVLDIPLSADEQIYIEACQRAAEALGLNLVYHRVRGPEEIEAAFGAMARQGTDALEVVERVLLRPHIRQIVDLAARHRLPAVYERRPWADAGGLMAYGQDSRVLHQRTAVHIDKILRGARPGDLPIEQPARFQLVINMRTVKALGLTLPPSVLVRADHIIE